MPNVDPDGAEDHAAATRDSRRVHLSQAFGNLWVLDGVLAPISGAMVSDALRRIADEFFVADWAETRARRGERAAVADLARSAAQRRHDALVEMARRLFTGATRRAVQVRDQELPPLCDEPAEFCQIDRVEPWSAGGHTVAANGQPACTYHNRQRTDDRSRRPGGDRGWRRNLPVQDRYRCPFDRKPPSHSLFGRESNRASLYAQSG